MADKIRLRKWKESDIEELFDLFSNKDVLKTMSNMSGKKLKLSDEKEWLKKTISEYSKNKPENLHLAITLNDKVIGGMGVNKIDYSNDKADVGYWIGKPFWGKGYTSIALKELIKLLFKRFKLKRIEAIAQSRNLASQKVLLKNGFRYEGEKIKDVKIKNKYYNRKYYALVK